MSFWDATRQQVIDDIQDLMARHDDLDWTMAAQSVAMNHGMNEQELIEDFREFFDGDSDPMGGMMGRNE